ncbi:hypothetical protein ACLKA6_016245 [Drosophila palustris]
MPAGHANAGAGPSNPVFHPGLGVDGVILPPTDTSKSKQSAKSAAKAPVGAGTAQTNRQRSQEAPGPSAKKSRVQPGRSFAQISKERILIGDLVKALRTEAGPSSVCKDVGWYQGNVKVLACDDERSAEFYKRAVSKIGDVYPGAKLVAIDWTVDSVLHDGAG